MGAGVFLFYQAFSQTEISKVVQDFKSAKYSYLFLSMAMGYIAFISRGIRWNLLLEPLGKKANTWRAIHAVAIGYLTNVAVPRAGELARCTSLNRTDKIPVDRLFGTVVLERLFDMVMLLIMMALTVILEYEKFISLFSMANARNSSGEEGGVSWLLISAGVIFIGVVLVFLLFRQRIIAHPVFQKVRNFWNGFKEGLQSFKKVKNKTAFIGHTIFIWVLYYLMNYIVVYSLDATEHIGPSAGLFVMVAGGLGMVVPTPGGVGSYHYLVMLAMTVLGISEADGFSFATLVHVGQMLMTFTGGGIAALAIYNFRRKSKRNEL